MTKSAGAILVLAALVVALAAPAHAKRAPTGPEAKAIRSAIARFIDKPGSPAASDNRIVRTRVSSVDSYFARVDLSSRSAGPSMALLKKKRTGWKVIAFGSADFPCSLAPVRVWVDLFGSGFCLAPDEGSGEDGGVVPYGSAS